MGQNSSTQTGRAAPVRRARPRAPPTPAPPPKPPAYAVAENCVLPGGTAADMVGARRLLRPVSQELSKFHPDFADIFLYNPEMDGLPRGDAANNENAHPASPRLPTGFEKPGSAPGNSSGERTVPSLFTDVTHEKFQTGPTGASLSSQSEPAITPTGPNAAISSDKLNKDHTPHSSANTTAAIPVQPNRPVTNLRRTQSMEARPRLQASKNHQGRFHKRQLSVTPVIPEDPREHLYNVARHEPFSNAQPAGASLPLASSFDLDYSFNVTYAQLADFRRKQRLEEMGGKLEELSAEIKASSTVPKSPFDRNNIGEKSATRSVSTGSSETGVSKSKKKKAPAPPPPANVPPLASMAPRDLSPSRLSMTTEPPADYDMAMDIPSTPSPPTPGRALHRSLSSAEESWNTSFAATARLTERNAGRQAAAQSPKIEVIASASPPPPPPPPAPPLPGTPGALKSSKPPASEVKPASTVCKPSSSRSLTAIPNQKDIDKSVAEAKAQLEALKKLEDVLRNTEPKDSKTASSPDVNANEKSESKVSGDITKDEEVSESSVSNSAEDTKTGPDSPAKTSPPKMSSLLQHDIVLAAQARGAKIVKTKPPPALERPKDISELFREELAKAATAREERRSREADTVKVCKTETPNEDTKSKSEEPHLFFKSSFLKVSKKPPPTMAKPEMRSLTTRAESKSYTNDNELENVTHLHKKEKKIDQSNDLILATDDTPDPNRDDPLMLSKRSSVQSEDMSISSSNASQRVFPPSWTPEDDLDSDDDIMNEEVPPRLPALDNRRNVSSEGFKSFVIPTRIDNLKKNKSKKKKKERKNEYKAVKDSPAHISSPRQQVPKEMNTLPNSNVENSPDLEDKDEKKFGSIRKFHQSVHKSVKNAFGSISKASGKLLKRRKSQDFLETPGDVSAYPPVQSEVSMNPNWALGENTKGSLRRVASEGHMPLATVYQNGIADQFKSEDSSSCSSESDEYDDDIGDIDFAGGIDRVAGSRKGNNNRNGKENLLDMKRAGVAYVSSEGKIIVLPERESPGQDKQRNRSGVSRVDKNPDRDSFFRAPKLFKKSNKKSLYISNSQYPGKKQEMMTPNTRAQENETETAHRRPSNGDVDSRRLQELEAQERLHRLETAKMQEQISLLQRQQLQRSHADLNSNIGVQGVSTDNNATSTTSNGGINGNHNTLLHTERKSPYLHSNGFLPGQQYANGNVNARVDTDLHRYSMPSFPLNTSHLYKQTQPRLATTADPVNYTAHSAPLVGGDSHLSPSPGQTAQPFAGFTSQELAYLSEYMRVMGVTPPSTQQQWAVLLSTFSVSNNNSNVNTSNKDFINYNYNNNVQNNMGTSGIPQNMFFQGSFKNNLSDPLFGSTFPNPGPNLSQVLGNAKTLDSTTSASKSQLLSLEPASVQPIAGVPNPSTLAGKLSSLDCVGHLQTFKEDLVVCNGSSALPPNAGNTQSAVTHPTLHTGAISSHTDTALAAPVPTLTSLMQDEAGAERTLSNGHVTSPGGDGVRSVTLGSAGSATTGVYGPMGFRQVLT